MAPGSALASSSSSSASSSNNTNSSKSNLLPLKYPAPEPLPEGLGIPAAKVELFGVKDVNRPESVAAHAISDGAVKLIYRLTPFEQAAYAQRFRTGCPPEVVIQEYRVVGKFAEAYNILPILSPNPSSSQVKPGTVAKMIYGHFPPLNKGAESHVFYDDKGEPTCVTYDLFMSALEAVGVDILDFVDIHDDVFPGVVPIKTNNGKQFNAKRHLDDESFGPIQEDINILHKLRFDSLKERGYTSVDVLLFGAVSKRGKRHLQNAADEVKGFDITFVEVGHPSALAIARSGLSLEFAKILDEGVAKWLGVEKGTFFR